MYEKFDDGLSPTPNTGAMEDALQIVICRLCSEGRFYATAVRLSSCCKALSNAFMPNDKARKGALRDIARIKFGDDLRDLATHLRRSGLLDHDCPEAWCRDTFAASPALLLRVFEEIGVFRENKSVNWCVRNFGVSQDLLFRAFEASNAFGQDKDTDWCACYFTGKHLKNALARCGIENIPSLQYIRSVRMTPRQLYDTLQAFCIPGRVLGVQWYLDNFSGFELRRILTVTDFDLQAYNDNLDWWIDFLGDCHYSIGVMDAHRMLVPDLGREWYARRFQGEKLEYVLRIAGLAGPEITSPLERPGLFGRRFMENRSHWIETGSW